MTVGACALGHRVETTLADANYEIVFTRRAGPLATHKTPKVKEWLIRRPRFHLHFTPISSSWLHLVERWFAELTNRKLRRSAHRSVTELEADVRRWINEWNATKTADQILHTSPHTAAEFTTHDIRCCSSASIMCLDSSAAFACAAATASAAGIRWAAASS
jgi:hypothetical protein